MEKLAFSLNKTGLFNLRYLYENIYEKSLPIGSFIFRWIAFCILDTDFIIDDDALPLLSHRVFHGGVEVTFFHHSVTAVFRETTFLMSWFCICCDSKQCFCSALWKCLGINTSDFELKITYYLKFNKMTLLILPIGCRVLCFFCQGNVNKYTDIIMLTGKASLKTNAQFNR